MNMNECAYTFAFDVTEHCNYRCGYCRSWRNDRAGEKLRTPAEWGEIGERLSRRYGRCLLKLSGGEPSTYPEFAGMVRHLAKNHRVEVCTNFSWDLAALIPELTPRQLQINATFHLGFADPEAFVSKAAHAKEYLNGCRVYCVAVPGQLAPVEALAVRLRQHAITLVPLPQWNMDGGIDNSIEEQKRTREITGTGPGDDLEYRLNELSPYGKRCMAGHRYALIHTDGSTDRCSQYRGGEMGNFFDPAFSLHAEPQVCTKKYCPVEFGWIVKP